MSVVILTYSQCQHVNVVMRSVIMLNVIMLNVIFLRVVVPERMPNTSYCHLTIFFGRGAP
jgi:hypothetical protein